jgi:hypothetical protein
MSKARGQPVADTATPIRSPVTFDLGCVVSASEVLPADYSVPGVSSRGGGTLGGPRLCPPGGASGVSGAQEPGSAVPRIFIGIGKQKAPSSRLQDGQPMHGAAVVPNGPAVRSRGCVDAGGPPGQGGHQGRLLPSPSPSGRPTTAGVSGGRGGIRAAMPELRPVSRALVFYEGDGAGDGLPTQAGHRIFSYFGRLIRGSEAASERIAGTAARLPGTMRPDAAAAL